MIELLPIKVFFDDRGKGSAFVFFKIIRSAAEVSLSAVRAFQKRFVFAGGAKSVELRIEAVSAIRADKGLGIKIVESFFSLASQINTPKNFGC